jgi:hypothetical protein
MADTGAMRRLAATATCAGLLLLAASPAAGAAEEPITSPNMSHVDTISYAAKNGSVPNLGTDIEFARIDGRQYALAGSYRNGLQVVDVTDPEAATIAGVYDCGVTQGDVQVFRQADLPGRTFATYTSDTFGDGTSTCYREAAALGFDVRKANGSGRNGTFILELTDPQNPTTVSFVEFAQGSHNMTVHPSGEWLYNSNSDLITSVQPAIEYTDVSDPFRPGTTREIALPTRPGLGTESHDITFNEDGSRAYSAALSQGVILDTTDPGDPELVTSFLNPAINVWHQADPFTLVDASGRTREYLVVEDEFAGAVGTGQCPNGGVWFYEVTGELERNPALVGYYNIDDVRPTTTPDGTCTAHVFDIHERAQVMTIAWYNGGARVLDLSGLTGVTVGGTPISGEGVKEIGSARFPSSDAWSAKTPRIHPVTGDFYLYANDIARGLDIWKFEGAGKKSAKPGRWMSGAEAQAYFAERRVDIPSTYSLVCLTPQ